MCVLCIRLQRSRPTNVQVYAYNAKAFGWRTSRSRCCIMIIIMEYMRISATNWVDTFCYEHNLLFYYYGENTSTNYTNGIKHECVQLIFADEKLCGSMLMEIRTWEVVAKTRHLGAKILFYFLWISEAYEMLSLHDIPFLPKRIWFPEFFQVFFFSPDFPYIGVSLCLSSCLLAFTCLHLASTHLFLNLHRSKAKMSYRIRRSDHQAFVQLIIQRWMTAAGWSRIINDIIIWSISVRIGARMSAHLIKNSN